MLVLELTFLIGTLALSCCAAPTDNTKNCPLPPQESNAELLGEWDRETYPPGHVANYGCHPGFVRQGPNIKKTCTEGNWESISRGKCIKRKCGHPGDIDFGTFVLKNAEEFEFGAIVEYSCDAGYQLASKYNTVMCTATGWSKERPHCEVLLCPPVLDASLKILSTVYDDEYSVGNVINFQCKNPQHKLYGPSHIFCTSVGRWNADPPTCKVPICPPVMLDDSVVLSSPHSNEYTVGHILNIQCKNQNYHLNGPSELRCTSEGEWNTDPPTCTGACTVDENKMRNHRIQLIYNQVRTVQHNQIVEFRCIDGHEISRQSHLRVSCNGGLLAYPTCQISGLCTLNENEMRNRGIRLKYNYGNTVQHGYYADFDCAPGYETYDYLSGYCDRGVFTYPTCYRSSCTVNDNEMRNRGILLQYRQSGTVQNGGYVYFDCAPGYERPHSGYVRAYCRRGQLEYPSCRKIDSCTVNGNEMRNHRIQLKYNHYQPHTVRNGEVVEFDCAAGYKISDPGYLTVYCNEGLLTYPTCQSAIEQDCSAPPPVDNGEVTGVRAQRYASGSSVQYQCAKDYKLDGKAVISCQDGKWEKEPICRVPCTVTEDDMKQNNIKLKHKNADKIYCEHLDNITFSCRQDYDISDTTLLRVQCLNGELKYPKCTKKEQGRDEKPCLSLPNVPYGEISGLRQQMYPSGSTVLFQCLNYYRLQGKPKIKCQNGNWEAPPVCRVPCTLNNKYLQGNNTQTKDKSKRYWMHGDTVTFQCLQGFTTLDPKQLSANCNDGNLLYPQCIKTTEIPGCVANETAINENHIMITKPHCRNVKACSVQHNKAFIFKCMPGFEASNSTLSVKCQNGVIEYPKCFNKPEIPGCVANETAINENHIMITNSHCKNVQACSVQHNKAFIFKCMPGFEASKSTLSVKCQNGVIEYPKCFNKLPEGTTVQPLVNTEVTSRRTY